MGASVKDLLAVYVVQVRCILEHAVPVWQGSLSLEEKIDPERLQRSAIKIILTSSIPCRQALLKLNLESLERRRINLSLKFALKAEKHSKFSK